MQWKRTLQWPKVRKLIFYAFYTKNRKVLEPTMCASSFYLMIGHMYCKESHSRCFLLGILSLIPWTFRLFQCAALHLNFQFCTRSMSGLECDRKFFFQCYSCNIQCLLLSKAYFVISQLFRCLLLKKMLSLSSAIKFHKYASRYIATDH